jgi:hypothetical protein
MHWLILIVISCLLVIPTYSQIYLGREQQKYRIEIVSQNSGDNFQTDDILNLNQFNKTQPIITKSDIIFQNNVKLNIVNDLTDVFILLALLFFAIEIVDLVQRYIIWWL